MKDAVFRLEFRLEFVEFVELACEEREEEAD